MRTATVRAVNSALVIEIAARHLEPLVRERPAILEELTALMHRRLSADKQPEPGLLQRISAAIFGTGSEARLPPTS
jgi:CRP-like cAMP-binding protein